MDYFILDTDERFTNMKRIDDTDKGFYGTEPFVTYLNFDKGELLPDFYQSQSQNGTFFCVSDGMKAILDSYGCLTKAVPFFLTDLEYRDQRIYWNIDILEKDCLKQELYADRNQLSFRMMPDIEEHLFKAVNLKKQYLIVSLELAENLLRRRLSGLSLYPVEPVSKEGCHGDT